MESSKKKKKDQAARETMAGTQMPAVVMARTAVQTLDRDKNKGVREMPGCQIKAVEDGGKERTFQLSFSSEEPYGRWFGTEILDHSDGCMDMGRLDSIGVVLYNHKRDDVIGKIDRSWIENGRGYAEITFDSDELSEKIYQKVKNGTLKGVSVGYTVDNWEEVMANKQSADGRFKGPCSVARKWTPYEISIVSVPADPTVGVGRSINEEGTDDVYETYKRQIQCNENMLKQGGNQE